MQQFPIQNYIAEHGAAISAMATKYEIKNDSIARVMETSGSFIIPVPLIGDFSCGKSSLLNAIVDEKLLSIDINPTTAIPAELYAAERESYALHRPGAAPQPIEKTQFKDLQKSIEKEATDAATSPALQAGQTQQPQTTYLSIAHPADNLKRWPHLRLVDLPGLGAGNERHKLAIDGYAARSLAYVLVVPCDEGTLKESVQAALHELGAQGLPVICVISKCDKRPSEDIDAVTHEIATQAEKALGRPPLLTVRAARGDVQAVINALVQLEQQAESICGRALGLLLAGVLRDVQQRQRTMRDKAKNSAEELQEDKANAERDAAAFGQRIAARSQELQSELPRIHQRAVDDMDAVLAARTDEWIDALLDGHAPQVQTQMENAARLALLESVGPQSEWVSVLRRYLEDLATDMPARFDPERLIERISVDRVDAPARGGHGNALDGLGWGATLAPYIQAILKFFKLPDVSKPIAVAIASVVGFFLGKKLDEAQEAKLLAAARDKARNALDDARGKALAAVAPKLLEAMQQQATEVQRLVQQDADARLQHYTGTLALIEQNLHQSEAQQQQLADDLAQTSAWLNAITAFPGAQS